MRSSFFDTFFRLQLVEGDVVRVIRGELKDLLGIVKTVDPRNKQVALSLSETAGLEGTYEFAILDLTKHFDIGKHVKVIGGHYSGETGTVVKGKYSKRRCEQM
jgi:transcription elongation factor SPT5